MESTRAVFNHEYGPMADAACSFCIICHHRHHIRHSYRMGPEH